MEEINEEDYAALVAEGVEEAVNEAVVKKEKCQGEDRESVNHHRHTAYLQLPAKVVFDIIKQLTVKKDGKDIPNPAFADGKVGDKFSAVEMPAECKNLPIKWTVKRVIAGWNRGTCCSTISQLNKLTAFNAQLEVIPIGYKEDHCTHVVVKKCRYDAVPYLPNMNFTRVARLLFREESGLIGRVAPANLLLAYKEAKVPWKVSAIAMKLLPRVTTAFPDKIPNGAAATAAMGQGALRLIRADFAELSVQPVFDIKNMVDPAKPDLSIFAGSVNSEWSAFFDGFSYDAFDPVPVSRGVADVSCKAYVGVLDDVAIWAQRPTILKTPHKLESILHHQHIPFRDLNRWPKEGLVYNPEYVDLRSIMSKMTVTHLVYPLHAMISNITPVRYFCKRHEFVDIFVLCTKPAVAVITANNAGLLGGSISKHLPRLERAFVLGFVKIINHVGVSDVPIKGFRIVPDVDYDATKCHIKIELIEGTFPYVCHRYVSMKKEEKERYVATGMLSDVVIDGVRAYKKPVGEDGAMAMYPRATPVAPACYAEPLALGMAFTAHGFMRDEAVTKELVDKDLTKFYVAADVSVDDPIPDSRVQGRYGDPVAEEMAD